MKRNILSLFFAATMMFSMAFIGDIASKQNPFSAQGQTVTVKKKKVGAIRKIYRGGKYVGRQVWNGTRWVGVKAWKGTKYVGKKTWKGTKWIGRKVY
jgi:hypothetical protein